MPDTSRTKDGDFINLLVHFGVVTQSEAEVARVVATTKQDSAAADLLIIEWLLKAERCSLNKIQAILIIQQLDWIALLVSSVELVKNALSNAFINHPADARAEMLTSLQAHLRDYDSKHINATIERFPDQDKKLYALLQRTQSTKDLLKELLTANNTVLHTSYSVAYTLYGYGLAYRIKGTLLALLPTKKVTRLQNLRKLQETTVLLTIRQKVAKLRQDYTQQEIVTMDGLNVQLCSIQREISRFAILDEFRILANMVNAIMNAICANQIEGLDNKLTLLIEFSEKISDNLPTELASLENENVEQDWLKICKDLQHGGINYSHELLTSYAKDFRPKTEQHLKSNPEIATSVSSGGRRVASLLNLSSISPSPRPSPSPMGSSPRASSFRLNN